MIMMTSKIITFSWLIVNVHQQFFNTMVSVKSVRNKQQQHNFPV